MQNQFTSASAESVCLLPGYKFCPTAKILIEFYLIKKINGVSIPHNPVKDCDVYGDPKIWGKAFEETGTKTLYFYTKLKNRKKRTRVGRTTEFGTWVVKQNFPIYDVEKKHIGSRRVFPFVAKEGFEDNAGWTMHEYRLDGINQNIPNEDGYVICQINKNQNEESATEDNSHQNIQEEEAQPWDEDILKGALENGDWIQQCYGQ